MAFASLKEVGMVSEFIPEQARLYIAKKKLSLGLEPKDTLKLTDEDQLNIMDAQVTYDETLVLACGPQVMIVSDSSPINAMLYMSPAFREEPLVKALLLRSLSITHHTFYSKPVPRPLNSGADPNRVHTFDQSLEIDKWIPEILKTIQLPITEIHGTTLDRVRSVQEQFLKSVRGISNNAT